MNIAPVGSTVAWNSPNHSWVLGTVVSFNASKKRYTCTSVDPETHESNNILNTDEHIFYAPPEVFTEDVSDLMNLTQLHESTVLFCLKRRYMRDIVYTHIGSILVALNPFNYNIPWYLDSCMENYLSQGPVLRTTNDLSMGHGEKDGLLLPHPWCVAHQTYYSYRETRRNQTIVISGESGSGKTEGVKIAVKYLTMVSSQSTAHGVDKKDNDSSIHPRIMAASPILESFGNAKTVRNDNSSRFGKFLKIQFGDKEELIGAHTTKYLLEKSRIVFCAVNERCYHSFYQLCASTTDSKKFRVPPAHTFRSLSMGRCTSMPHVDDSEAHNDCKQALSHIGVTNEVQESIWKCIAGILYLQNVTLEQREEKGLSVAFVDSSSLPDLHRAMELWGLASITNSFAHELVCTTSLTRGERLEKPLNRESALDVRDSVSKALYDALFDWLVVQINRTTDRSQEAANWIGLLDIFGFEDFQHNSFEQLCINLANEALQHHYNHHIFTEDMKECEREGVDVSQVVFGDNLPCLELLMGRTRSVFAMIDEEGKVSGSDRNLLEKLNQAFGTPTRSGSTAASSPTIGPGSPFFIQVQGKWKDNHFGIRHYAGDVIYCVDQFLEKNKETLKPSIRNLFEQSTDPLIASLLAYTEGATQERSVTVGTYFRTQLKDLMDMINSTNPHWIRCIKPHPAKQPRLFSHKSVLHQLRSAGVMYTIRIRKLGFPVRLDFPTFCTAFSCLQQHTAVLKAGKNAVADNSSTPTQRILTAYATLRSQVTHSTATPSTIPSISQWIQLGKSKVFLKQECYEQLIGFREEVYRQYVNALQRWGRGSLHGRHVLFLMWVDLQREAILERRRIAQEQERLRAEEEQRRRAQEEIRRREEQERMAVLRSTAVLHCQRMVRGWLARVAFYQKGLEEMRSQDERLTEEVICRMRQVHMSYCSHQTLGAGSGFSFTAPHHCSSGGGGIAHESGLLVPTSTLRFTFIRAQQIHQEKVHRERRLRIEKHRVDVREQRRLRSEQWDRKVQRELDILRARQMRERQEGKWSNPQSKKRDASSPSRLKNLGPTMSRTAESTQRRNREASLRRHEAKMQEREALRTRSENAYRLQQVARAQKEVHRTWHLRTVAYFQELEQWEATRVGVLRRASDRVRRNMGLLEQPISGEEFARIDSLEWLQATMPDTRMRSGLSTCRGAPKIESGGSQKGVQQVEVETVFSSVHGNLGAQTDTSSCDNTGPSKKLLQYLQITQPSLYARELHYQERVERQLIQEENLERIKSSFRQLRTERHSST